MNDRTIEDEVRRLAPWYYLFHLGGVRTDITEPFDHWGHRRAEVPMLRPDFWQGMRVLDLGCNEGGLSFSALNHGAAFCHGIDCRDANVEKARFVAEVLGYSRVAFETGEVDDWLARNPERAWDIVLACGLLYHLPAPWSTLRRICGVARQAVVVTSVLAGGSDGETPFEEAESIGASANPELLSRMPNTAITIAEQLSANRFAPTFISEDRAPNGDVWGGCMLLAERSNVRHHGEPRDLTEETAELALYATTRSAISPAASPTLEVLLYDLSGRRRQIAVELTQRVDRCGVTGRHTLSVDLPARPIDEAGPRQSAASRTASFELDPAADGALIRAFEGRRPRLLLERNVRIEREPGASQNRAAPERTALR